MKLWEKVVVVTGGGGGIGRAIVIRALARGARVAAVDIRADRLEETAAEAEAGERLSLHCVDVSDREAVAALPDAVVEHHGRVDVLINNAGIVHPFRPLAELDEETIDRVLQVNLGGVIWPTRAFLPRLLASKPSWIANVSSVGGFVPFPRQSIYCASKAAVHLLTEALYEELHETGVGVTCVLPGPVATNILDNSSVTDAPDAGPLGPQPMSADEASRQILDGIEKGRRHVLVGAGAKAMWVADRVAPNLTADLMERIGEQFSQT